MDLFSPSPTCRSFDEKENAAEDFIGWRDYLRDLSQNLKEMNMRLQRFVKGNPTLRSNCMDGDIDNSFDSDPRAYQRETWTSETYAIAGIASTGFTRSYNLYDLAST